MRGILPDRERSLGRWPRDDNLRSTIGVEEAELEFHGAAVVGAHGLRVRRVPVQQMLERDMFEKRMSEGKPIGLPDQGSMFLGEKGAILLPHVAMPLLLPLKQFAETKIDAAPDGNHYHLFVDACLGGAPTTAHFGYAGPLTESVLLGGVATFFPNQLLEWDAKHLKFKNKPEADRLIRRTHRKGWEVPGLS